MASGDEPDISGLSLEARARLAALIEHDGDEDLRVHLLGAVGRAETPLRPRSAPRDLPPQWTMVHVLDRLEEAYEVLAALPARTRPREFGNGMPTPVREKLTNKDWIDLLDTGEIEQFAQDVHRVRLAPTTAQITRMDQALRWPFEYLSNQPEIARAINLRALWAVLKIDIRKRCAERGFDHQTFNLHWQVGLRMITEGLIQGKIAVS